jgi:hypothetical protein
MVIVISGSGYNGDEAKVHFQAVFVQMYPSANAGALFNSLLAHVSDRIPTALVPYIDFQFVSVK